MHAGWNWYAYSAESLKRVRAQTTPQDESGLIQWLPDNTFTLKQANMPLSVEKHMSHSSFGKHHASTRTSAVGTTKSSCT